MPTSDSRLLVAGIDVGASQKGFHAVALQDGVWYQSANFKKAGDAVRWCCDLGVDIVGVDAPCRWGVTGRARPAERALMAEKIWCFSTPSYASALAHPKNHYGWMLAGATLFDALEVNYAIYRGGVISGKQRICFETFPHAITRILSGRLVSAKNKRRDRRALLGEAGIKGKGPGSIN